MNTARPVPNGVRSSILTFVRMTEGVAGSGTRP
jgi:hypothetical protein